MKDGILGVSKQKQLPLLHVQIKSVYFHFRFLQALFCSSLPHPGADKDYALYEVGNGCEVEELIPGIDLLSEAFRSNGRSVVASLRWITEELARARYLLTVSDFN